MTAGIVVILGPVGGNLGSGMTGGLVYTLRRSLASGRFHREFVRCAGPSDPGADFLANLPASARGGASARGVIDDDQEEVWLRRVLDEHVRLTGSPRAKRLLNADARLPLVRLEPRRLACSIAQTWAPILDRLEKQAIIHAEAPGSVSTRHLHPPPAAIHGSPNENRMSEAAEAAAPSLGSAHRGGSVRARPIAKPAC